MRSPRSPLYIRAKRQPLRYCRAADGAAGPFENGSSESLYRCGNLSAANAFGARRVFVIFAVCSQ